MIAALMLVAVMFIAGCTPTAPAASQPAEKPAEQPAVEEKKEEAPAQEAPVAEEGTKKLTLAWLGAGQDKENFDKIISKYTQATGVEVETVFIPGTWGEYFTKIQTMIAGGQQVDVAFVAIEGFRMMIDSGLAQPLDPYIEKNKEFADKVLNDMAPELRDALAVDGKIYAFPTEWNDIVIHMNTKMFADAGVELPKADWTKDDFLAAAEKITMEKDGQKQYAFSVPAYYFMIEAWLKNNGVAMMNKEMTKSTINTPEAVEVIQFLQDLIHKYGYAPIPEPNVDPIQQLIDGKVAMGSFGRWPTLSYIANDFTDVAIQYVPKFSTQQNHFGIGGIAVVSDANYDEAAKFALWCGDDEFIGDYLSVGAIPARKSLADVLVMSLDMPQNKEIFYESANGATPVSAPAAYAECDAIVNAALSKIFVENADVQATLDEAATKMDEALAAS